MRRSGVIFDLGGVVFESPIDRIAEFEERSGLEPQTVARVIKAQPNGGAWSRLECGRVDRATFLEEFDAEFRDRGLLVDVTALLEAIESALVVRPEMIGVVDRLRLSGVTVAALTNNWSPMSHLPIAAHFDVFVESVTEGCRKPEPDIYLRTLDRMGCVAREVAMLDDLGENLKTARELGMATHKVVDSAAAMAWLSRRFDVDLTAASEAFS